MCGLPSSTRRMPQPPICRLPDDVLLNIFVDIYGPSAFQEWRGPLGTGDHQPSPRTIYPAYDLARLGQVCRRWRYLIHGFPHFWSHLELSAWSRSRKPELRAVYCLERAAGVPLSINIDQHIKYRRSQQGRKAKPKHLVRLAALLQEVLRQVISLSLNMHPYLLQTFLETCAGTTNQLKNLDVSGSSVLTAPSPIITIPFERDLGSGSGVSVRSNWIPAFTPSFGMAVTHLQLRLKKPYAFDNILGVLRSCPNLLNFSLMISSDTWVAPVSTGPVSLVHLMHLSVECTAPNRTDELLPLLETDSLQSLHIPDLLWDGAAVAAITSVIENNKSLSSIRLGCHASQAVVNRHHPIPSSLGRLTCNAVTELRVRGIPTISHLLRRLSLPNLEHLEIGNVPLDVVLSLISPSTRVKSITSHGVYAVPGNIDAGFRTLPALTSLQIKGFHGILSRIKCPQLKTLAISCRYGGPETSGQVLRNFMTQSPPPLLSLLLSRVLLEDAELL
ncbi:hypothetical protein BOTBODRAFT_606817 [Botryobasidium botryosum FD-172 SS1]|uniref:F-box domain-containing protein n=1 Tax=Botryobasidium botryosum (strain FD-172 SS1) TaxID=930990 RepID=A0A067MNW1_BOTB1|nr:hypothetical protein BOTBODRAFT_606817 [Botryobasidium botryosum FD-172 SS1]